MRSFVCSIPSIHSLCNVSFSIEPKAPANSYVSFFPAGFRSSTKLEQPSSAGILCSAAWRGRREMPYMSIRNTPAVLTHLKRERISRYAFLLFHSPGAREKTPATNTCHDNVENATPKQRHRLAVSSNAITK